MTFKKYSFILIFVAIFALLIVACNNEVTDNDSAVTVSFAPSVGKALNQDGKTHEMATSTDAYIWMYWVQEGGNPSKDSQKEWNFFEDAMTGGLGTIKNLEKNHSYFFGLQGYEITSDSDIGDLVWEGYCYEPSSSLKTLKATQLATRKTMVTIDVEAVGTGRLFFNISAPSYLRLTTATDRFVYSFGTLGGTGTSGTDTYLVSTYDEDSDAFFYQTPVDSPELILKADDYLFTVRQQTYDPEADTADKYVDVPGRKQVVIATIQSGIDTVIAGSLDSTSGLIKFDYEGKYDETNMWGILTSFTDADPAKVHEFKTIVYLNNPDDNIELVKATRKTTNQNNYFEIGLPTDNYGTIVWSTASDDVHLYVNGEKLLETKDYPNYTSLTDAFPDNGLVEADLKFDGKFVTVTAGSNKYCIRRQLDESNNYTGKLEKTLVREPERSGNKTLVVEGLKNYKYLLTLQYKTEANETESVVFSVEGGVILVTSIELNATSLELTLDPGVKFTNNTAWKAAGIEDPTVTYYKVTTAGATSGGTLYNGAKDSNGTPTEVGYYYAVVSITGADNKTASVTLPTEVK